MTARTNATVQQSVQFSFFTEDQCREIYQSALRVLEYTGFDMKNEKAKKILKDAGAKVEGDQVWMRPIMVENALKTAPKQITIYNREGKPQMECSAKNGRSYWTLGTQNQFINDRHTDEKRLTTYNDTYEIGLVCDALPNIDLVADLSYVSDCNPMAADIYDFKALLESTSKPLLFTQLNCDNLHTQMEMIAAVCGSVENFVAKPFGITTATPTTPLGHSDEALERAMYQWELGIPSLYSASPMMGGTSPLSIAGAFSVGLADTLVGVVLSQLINPGTPIFGNASPAPFEMSSMSPSLTSPELMQGAAAHADIFRYINLPYFVLLNGTSSPIFDEQAACDIGQQTMIGTIAGCSICAFTGFLADGMSSAIEDIVFCNESIGIARRFVQGAPVTEESLAEDVTHNVGPLGHFLAEPHTVKHFREAWTPSVFERRNYEAWSADGKKTARQRCIEKVDEIVNAGPTKPLAPEVIAKLDEIVKAAEAKY